MNDSNYEIKKKNKKIIIIGSVLFGILLLLIIIVFFMTNKKSKWNIYKVDNQFCSNEISTLYEDSKFKYTINDSCINDYEIVYSNGEKFSIKDALDQGKVSIDDLISSGVSIKKEEKNTAWSLDKGSDDQMCIQVITTIYEDNDYKYSVSDGCVANYKVVFNNGEVYSLSDALSQGKVSIYDLISKGVKITKENKNIEWTIDKGSDDQTCIQVITTIYEDNDYKYNVSDGCVANYNVVFSNGERYSLREALSQRKISIIDLVKKGIKITKEAKNTNITWTIDKGSDDQMCIQVITTIYEDSNYKYNVSDGCVADYKVVYSNGERYSLREALSQGKVTINDLINKGVNISKEAKSTNIITWTIDKGSDGQMCMQALVTIYEDSNYIYSVPNACVADYKVVFSNGERYSLKDALSQGKVTINDLISKGINISKEIKNLTWTIDDNTKGSMCSQSITTIYEDDNYKYTVPDACVASYKVVFSNGERYLLRDALSLGKVTINDLISKGINISKESKHITWTIDKGSDDQMCMDALVTIYEDNNYIYTVPDACVADYKVVFSNGERYSLKEALSQGKVTYEELVNQGITIYKDKK